MSERIEEMVPHDFEESVADLRDWFRGSTGGSGSKGKNDPVIVLAPYEERRFQHPPTPAPIVRGYKGLAYDGARRSIRVVLHAGVQGRDEDTWVPFAEDDEARHEFDEPVILVPQEPAEFLVRNLTGDTVTFRLRVYGADLLPKGGAL